MKPLFFAIALWAIYLSFPSAQATPALRQPDQKWTQTASQLTDLANLPADTALAKSLRGQTLFNLVPEIDKKYPWNGNLADLQSAFVLARDSRVVPWRADFARRPSWLYPDDGCYARAVVAADTLIRNGFPKPGKIFAFGDLVARTKHTPSGSVTWWYHVAVAYEVGEELMVFDPSVDESRPLSAKEWVQLIGGDKGEVKVTLCHTKAMSPMDSCEAGNPFTVANGFREQLHYLDLEWERVLELGLQPIQVLGTNPPWL